jgi:hypothetical protein
MIHWEELADNGDGVMVYQRIDEDGKVRLTAVKGYPELDAYLAWVEAGNNPDEFWTQTVEL